MYHYKKAISILKAFLTFPQNSYYLSSYYSLPSISIHSSSFLNSSKHNKKEDANEDESYFKDSDRPPKLFVVQPRLRPDTLLKSKLSEALNLANSLEEQRDGCYGNTHFEKRELPPHVVVQNPVARNTRTESFFGKGTVDTIQCHLNALQSKDEFDAVFVNAVLSAIQQRNLEKVWKIPVLDRVGLIIEIFNAHAQTREAKLQAELAALMYKKARLIRMRGPGGRYTFGESGEAEVVSARGRGSGGRGFISGAGETELQLQRRRILERRNRLLTQIEEVRRTRSVQRASRKRHGGSQGQELATVAVVGYTNAGKSTLVSALSENDLYSDDHLFATVDPRLRSVILPSGRKILLSDTVGFISDLPVQLIEAFHATLEEVVEADLLVHVLDSSAANLDEHRSSVLQVLEQIGIPEEKIKNMIEVWNKIDIQEEEMPIDAYLDDSEDDEAVNNNAEDDGMASEPSRETKDVVSELLTGEYTEDDGMNDVSDLAIDIEDDVDDEQREYSDGRETEHAQQSSALGLSTLNDKKSESFQKDVESRIQNIPHVKTSAVMGVGLQELLVLIDQKVITQKVVDQSSFDRKWRPPRKDEDVPTIAVEQ